MTNDHRNIITEVPKSVSLTHHSQATTEMEEVLAPPPTDSLPIDVVELMEEPTPGDGVEGLQGCGIINDGC